MRARADTDRNRNFRALGAMFAVVVVVALLWFVNIFGHSGAVPVAPTPAPTAAPAPTAIPTAPAGNNS